MKQSGIIRWGIAIGVLYAGMAGADEGALKVNADRVNLRARPAYESEVVCQAQTGDLLTPVGIQGDWRGVRPPATAPVWVHASFVTNAQVKSRLNVRGGPGINFSSIAVLQKGDTVKVRSTFGDWLQIEAPTSSVLWVHKDFVTGMEGPTSPPPVSLSIADTNAVPPIEVATPPVVVTPEKTPAPPELAAKGLKPEIQQGVRKIWEGQVQPIDFLFNRPGNYRLVRAGGESGTITVCYLKGNDAQLSSFVGRKVQVTGWEYWLNQTDLPVIVPETIAPTP
jgi:SH3-like domain-containing protein